MITDKKQLIEKWMQVIQATEKKSEHLSNALSLISDDPINVDLIDYDQQTLMDNMLEEIIGKAAFESLMWWMYDSTLRGDESKLYNDGVNDIDVTDFDVFCKVVLGLK